MSREDPAGARPPTPSRALAGLWLPRPSCKADTDHLRIILGQGRGCDVESEENSRSERAADFSPGTANTSKRALFEVSKRYKIISAIQLAK